MQCNCRIFGAEIHGRICLATPCPAMVCHALLVSTMRSYAALPPAHETEEERGGWGRGLAGGVWRASAGC
eukprot:5393952-Pyramimonas_sp.AAC.1